MATSCDFKGSEASTKAWFRTNNLINEFLDILDLPKFRKANMKWSNYARITYGVEGKIFEEDNNGTKARPNSELFKKIDNAKGVLYQLDPSTKVEVTTNKLFNPDMAPDGYSKIITLNGEYIGEFALLDIGDETHLSGSLGARTEIEESKRGKGYGYKAYLELAKQVKVDNKILVSDSNMSDQAIAIWDKLVGKGYAYKTKDDYDNTIYKIKNDALIGVDTLDTEIEITIKNWLEKVGIKYNSVDKIYDTNGNEVDAIAKANIFARVIEVIENKRGIDTLPEEAAHMLVRMLGLEHSLVQAMMNNVHKYQIYQDVLNSPYGELYKNDDAKLREEAVGKLIAQIIVAQSTGKALPKEMTIEVNRWNLAWKWLTNRLSRLIGTDAVSDLDAFKQAADIIMENKPIVEGMEWVENSVDPTTEFYEINEQSVEQKINTLKSTGIYYDVKIKAYFTAAGRKIAKRVTDLVKAIERKQFKNAKKTEQTPESKLSAAGGIVIHAYKKYLTARLIENSEGSSKGVLKQTVSQEYIQKLVQEDLMQDPEMVKRGAEFMIIDKDSYIELLNNTRERLAHIYRTQEFINKETGTNGKVEILPEFTIYDATRDIAGTIDLLVIYSNGKGSIYDYKGRKFFMGGKNVIGEFPLSKIKSGEDQLRIYTDILRQQFGIDEFIETRLVPFNIQFFKGKIKYVEIGADGARDYIEEIPVLGELTNIPEIDKQLRKMFLLKAQLETRLKANYKDQDSKNKLEKIVKSIRKLQLEQDTSYAAEELMAIIKDYQQRITRYEDTKKGVDIAYLNDLVYYLGIYDQFFIDAKYAEFKKGYSKEDEIGIENLYNKLNADIQYTISQAEILKKDLLIKKYDVDFDKPVKEISNLGAMFKRLSEFNRVQFKLLYNLIARREHYVREKIQEINSNLTTLKQELSGWARGNGMSLQEAMDSIVSDKGSLKSKYNGVYSKEKKEAVENKDYNWFLANTNVEIVDGKFQYTDEEARKKFAETKKNAIELINKNNQGKYLKKVRENKIEEWERQHDINANREALFNNPYYIKPIEQDRFASEIWLYMNKPENKPLLDTYNALINYNLEFAEITGRDIKATFIPEIQNSIVESLSNWNVGTSALKDNLHKAFTVREQDVLMGNVNRDPETGEIIPSIPLLYTDNLSIPLSEKELQEVKNELEKRNLKEGDTGYLDEIENLIRVKEREKGLLIKSKDLFTSALLFAESAYTYQYSQEIEEDVKAIRSTFEGVETEMTSTTGKKVVDKITGRIAKIVGAPKDELEAYDKFVKLYLYGQKVQNKDYSTEGGLSANKTLRQAMRYTSLKALGLSWIPAFGNLIGTTSNTLMLASEGKYFKTEHIKKGIGMLNGKDKETINPLLQYFSPYAHDLTYEISRNLSASKARKHLNEDTFYMLMKYPDKGIDVLVALGVLQNWGINKDGRVRQVGAEVKPLLETLKIENDKVTGLTEEQYVMIRKLMTDASNKIKGSVSKEDQNLIGTNIYTAMFMQFRNWMPGLIKARFQGLTYEEEYDTLDVGRFRVLYGEFTKKGLLPKLQTFGNLLAEVAALGMYKGFSNSKNQALAQKYFERYLEENPDMRGKITLDQLIELRVQKLKGIATELRILLGMYASIAMLGAAVPDDEDGKNIIQKTLSLNAYRFANRGLLEISFFFDPASVTQIIKQPLPMWRNITDIQKAISNTIDEGRDLIMGEDYKGLFKWELDPHDRTNFMYYTSKQIPGNRVFTDIIDFFDTFEQQMK